MKIDQLASLVTVRNHCSTILNSQNKLSNDEKNTLRSSQTTLDSLFVRNITLAIRDAENPLRPETMNYMVSEVRAAAIADGLIKRISTQEMPPPVVPEEVIAQIEAKATPHLPKVEVKKKKAPSYDAHLLSELVETHPSMEFLANVIETAKTEAENVKSYDEFLVLQAKMVDKNSQLAQAASYVKKLDESQREHFSPLINQLKLTVGSILAAKRPEAPSKEQKEATKPLSPSFQKLGNLTAPNISNSSTVR